MDYGLVSGAILLIYLLIRIFIRSRVGQYLFCSIVILFGLYILFYSYFTEKPTAADYKIEQISYTDCVVHNDRNEIVLTTEQYEYVIPGNLIVDVSTKENAASILAANLEAKVWVRDAWSNRKMVRGLEADGLILPISYGIQLDDPSKYALFGWVILPVGIMCLLFTWFLDLRMLFQFFQVF